MVAVFLETLVGMVIKGKQQKLINMFKYHLVDKVLFFDEILMLMSPSIKNIYLFVRNSVIQ